MHTWDCSNSPHISDAILIDTTHSQLSINQISIRDPRKHEMSWLRACTQILVYNHWNAASLSIEKFHYPCTIESGSDRFWFASIDDIESASLVLTQPLRQQRVRLRLRTQQLWQAFSSSFVPGHNSNNSITICKIRSSFTRSREPNKT